MGIDCVWAAAGSAHSVPQTNAVGNCADSACCDGAATCTGGNQRPGPGVTNWVSYPSVPAAAEGRIGTPASYLAGDSIWSGLTVRWSLAPLRKASL